MRFCKKSRILLLTLSLIHGFCALADEGMWLLSMLKRYNAAEMQRMGLKVPLESITGEEEGSLSEAVVSFGGGCTGSFVSEKGLILTNYHCSYGAIQQHNGEGLAITRNGFWAENFKQELPVNGLSVTVVKRIVDITHEVQLLTQKKIPVKDAFEKVAGEYRYRFPDYKVVHRTYRNNTIFVLYLMQQYNDVRLVGIAPKQVAKFGGETDNWMWPRHSADFAFFRVYADAKGRPAKYHSQNVALNVDTYLKVSNEGYKIGDFSMSLGYPGVTNRDASAASIWEKTYVYSPANLAVKETKMNLLQAAMNTDDKAALVYGEKFATLANECKNLKGFEQWSSELNLPVNRAKGEDEWVNKFLNGSKRQTVEEALASSRRQTKEQAEFSRAFYLLNEVEHNGSDIIRFLNVFGKNFSTFESDLKKRPTLRKDYLTNVSIYYKQLIPAVDKELIRSTLYLLADSLNEAYWPSIMQKQGLHAHKAIDAYVEEIFIRSVFIDSARLKKWLVSPAGVIENDPALLLALSLGEKSFEMFKMWSRQQDIIRRQSTVFRATWNAENPGMYYPDADKTLRLSYGTITGLQSKGTQMPWQTLLSGLVHKSQSTNPDYVLHPLLQKIWEVKDFGQWGFTDDFPVCFITNGDVTGGNSGSPMLNAHGELIGLVFDCNWESMTREYNYDPDLNRVICCDIRYIMMLTGTLSGSKRLQIEMAGIPSFAN